MTNLRVISIHITLEVANDPACEAPVAPQPSGSPKRCEHWLICENPQCFRHGFLNMVQGQDKEERHV